MNKKILWDISYGVYVVSAMDKEKPTGCIINTAVQLTENKIGVCINHNNYTNSIIKENKNFALTILSEKTNPNIIATFGFTSGREKNKFDGFEYKMFDNLPVLLNSKGYIALKLVQAVELETHTFFIGEIIDGDVFNNEIPMTYKYYHDVIKGRAPKAAPTYIAPDELNETKPMGKRFRCKVCGYIYEGDIEKEPPNFVCPVCKQPKSVFEEIAYA